MKNFLSAIALCLFLTLIGLIFLLPKSSAEENVLQNLLDLPSLSPANPLVAKRRTERDKDFYSRDKPPPDDAPIEDIMEYWRVQSEGFRRLGYNIFPSERSLERILNEVENDPEKLMSFLSVMTQKPEAAEVVKRIYDRELSEKKFGRDWRDVVKTWLTYNSPYFSDTLMESAKEVKDANEYVTNQDELLALARVDWEKARPFLERMLNDSSQPVSQTLAKWAFYRHALDTNSTFDIDKYREELKKVVEDKKASPGNRDLAIDALTKEKDWDGRDDWYFTLLEDETLAELKVNGQTYTGLTTLLYYLPPNKHLKKMIELTKSSNPNVRQAAIRNLITMMNQGSEEEEIIKALLPWLENPEWAKQSQGERETIVRRLSQLKMSESVPGLIAALNEKTTIEEEVYSPAANAANTAANMARSVGESVNIATNTVKRSGEKRTRTIYPLRNAAISALAFQKDITAVGALRQVLPEVLGYERNMVVRAILESGGFSVSEQVSAIEQNSKERAKFEELVEKNTQVSNSAVTDVPSNSTIYTVSAGAANISTNTYNRDDEPFRAEMIPSMLGQILVEKREADEALVQAVVERIESLERTDLRLAGILREVLSGWTGTAVSRMMLKDLKNKKATTQVVLKLLTQRKELRSQLINEVYEARQGNAVAGGISACILEEPSEYQAILQSENQEVIASMLACARLIRAELPIAEVAKHLNTENKVLLTAVERYLETEDSELSKNYLYSKFPDKIKILGGRTFIVPENTNDLFPNDLYELFATVEGSWAYGNYYFEEREDFDEAIEKIRQEIKENKDLLGAYGYNSNYLRIYGDRVVFSWEDNSSRYHERVLEKEEFESFKNLLTSNNVAELKPFVYPCDHESECDSFELLMIGRQGGRRVFFTGYENDKPQFLKDLEKLLGEFREKPAKLHYWLEKYIPNLEILYTDDRLKAKTIWKSGNVFKVLTEDEEKKENALEELNKQVELEMEKPDVDYEKQYEVFRKRRAKAMFVGFTWFNFENGKLGAVTAKPSEINYSIPDFYDEEDGYQEIVTWHLKHPTFEIKFEDGKLFKVVGGRTTRIGENDGYYGGPRRIALVTPDGKWLLTVKMDDSYEYQLTRINLVTNRETKVGEFTGYSIYPVAYLSSVNKFLVNFEESNLVQIYKSKYVLIDPITGAIQAVKGEFQPLKEQFIRALQSTSTPNEFWATINEGNNTDFGIYNTKTFSFKSLLKLPKIRLSNMDIYVEEAEGKIYFVYEGHILRIPLPKPEKKTP